jgi:hypothetical protein
MRGRFLPILAVTALGLLAGCSGTQGPPRPAMVALDSNGDYGFSETKLGESEYQVRYVEPRLQVASDQASRQSAIETAKQRSYDLALLRATQLAEAQGYPALEVVRERRDADVDVTERLYRRVWPFAGFGYYGHPFYGHRPWFPYHYDEYPYFPYHPYDYDYVARDAAYARVSTTLTVKFLREPGGGALDVAETAASLQKRYAGVTFPPR